MVMGALLFYTLRAGYLGLPVLAGPDHPGQMLVRRHQLCLRNSVGVVGFHVLLGVLWGVLGAEGFAERFLQGAALQLGVHTTGIRGVGGDGSPCSSPDPVCLLVLEPSHLMQQPIRKTHTFFSSKVEQQSSHGLVIGMCQCAGVCSESIDLVTFSFL
ncbi:hypothetical protein MUK42_37308 [Musa troglodytarum]|uniref:Uncharacterized protein n=1 Tax=Musa troglodytarum TaxID=320322 RepID=A0A9E7EGD1_9LILI|nr:hypothetical protein MUK42_37308 [Musa troglodytarum]